MNRLAKGALLALLLSLSSAQALSQSDREAGGWPDPEGTRSTAVEPAGEASAIVDLDTVVVTGRQTGPGLWSVRNGENVLYILGTVSPLPARMEWVTDEVEAAIAQSSQVIWPPGFRVGAGGGLLRNLRLAPAALRARRNPDRQTLADVLPGDVYARWQPLKQRYLGNDRSVENWRPLFAAGELYAAAIRNSGMAEGGVVTPVIERAAKRHGVERVSATVEVRVENPRQLLADFNARSLDDVDCFAKTLDRIETDLEAMRRRANAWAAGNIAALQRLPHDDHYGTCLRVLTESGLAAQLGADDIAERSRARWLELVEAALDSRTVTFATLPVSALLVDDGLLARLQARGYSVEPPGSRDN